MKKIKVLLNLKRNHQIISLATLMLKLLINILIMEKKIKVNK